MTNTVSPRWLVATGASPSSIERLQQEVSGLPASYLKCLSIGNGGEVGLSVSPYNFCLDSAESALDYWLSGKYTKQGVFIFGGNGGGELLAFELGLMGQCPVVCFDPISPDDSTELVAASFEELLKLCEE
jgi:hypothetical protein